MDKLTSAEAGSEVSDFYLDLILRIWKDMIDWRVRVLRILASTVYSQVLTYRRIAKMVGAPIQTVSRIIKEIEVAYPDRFNTHRVVLEGGWCSAKFPGGQEEHARRLRADGVGTNRIPRKNGEIRLEVIDFIGHLHGHKAA